MSCTTTASRSAAAVSSSPSGGHQRMDDRVEPFELPGIGEHLSGQCRPVERAVRRRALRARTRPPPPRAPRSRGSTTSRASASASMTSAPSPASLRPRWTSRPDASGESDDDHDRQSDTTPRAGTAPRALPWLRAGGTGGAMASTWMVRPADRDVNAVPGSYDDAPKPASGRSSPSRCWRRPRGRHRFRQPLSHPPCPSAGADDAGAAGAQASRGPSRQSSRRLRARGTAAVVVLRRGGVPAGAGGLVGLSSARERAAQYAPEPRTTASTVLSRMVRSSGSDQFST